MQDAGMATRNSVVVERDVRGLSSADHRGLRAQRVGGAHLAAGEHNQCGLPVYEATTA
jgi:hypothetical protein